MSTSPRAALAVCLLGPLALLAAGAEPAPAGAGGDPLPAGAVARLGSARLRHAAGGLAWAPDGKTFASAAADGLVREWDAADGKEVRSFRAPPGASLGAAAYLPDGKSVAAAGSDAMLHVWDRTTGREVHTVPVPGTPPTIARLAAGPGDGQAAAVGSDNVLRVLDLTTGKVVRQVDGNLGGLAAFTPCTALSADGRRFAVCRPATPTTTDLAVVVWDAADGKELFHAPTGFTGFKSTAGLALSADGKTVAAFSGVQPFPLVTWDVDSGKEPRRYERMGALEAAAFSPDGKYLAARGKDHTVRLWGLASGEELRRFDLPPYLPPAAGAAPPPAFSPDGKKLAACQGSAIYLWDLEADRDLHEYIGHFAAVDDLRFSSDGKRLVSCGKEPAARWWDVASGKQIGSWTNAQAPNYVTTVCPDGKAVVADPMARVVRVELDEGKPAERLLIPPTPGRGGFAAAALMLSADGKTLAVAYAGGGVDFVDAETGKERMRISSGPGLYATFALSPDGRLLAQGGVNVPVRLWDVAAGKEVRQLDAADPAPAVPPGVPPAPSRQFRGALRLSFSPDGKSLACLTKTDLSLWEVATGRQRLRAPREDLTSVVFSPDGSLLAAGTTDGAVVVLDPADGREVGRRGGAPGAGVTSVVFAPDGKTLASGAADGSILIWDVTEWAGKALPAADLKPEKLSVLWNDLLTGDAGRAYKAVLTLAADPKAAAPFLKDRLAGVEDPGDRRTARLIRDLNDDLVGVREGAQRELEKQGDAAISALHKALESDPPPETRRRVEELLERLKGAHPVTEEVRGLRAVEALERSGATEAVEALRALAKDAPDAQVKREAAAALDRLTRRPAAP